MVELHFHRANELYGIFSNFHPSTIRVDGLTYGSVEAAFQSMKTLDREERKKFTTLTPGQAKRLGRSIQLRPDWETIKYDVMYTLLLHRFYNDEEFRETLLATKGYYLIEDTTGWHDNCWGDCQCAKCKNIPGRNHLGKTLMKLRDLALS